MTTTLTISTVATLSDLGKAIDALHTERMAQVERLDDAIERIKSLDTTLDLLIQVASTMRREGR